MEKTPQGKKNPFIFERITNPENDIDKMNEKEMLKKLLTEITELKKQVKTTANHKSKEQDFLEQLEIMKKNATKLAEETDHEVIQDYQEGKAEAIQEIITMFKINYID